VSIEERFQKHTIPEPNSGCLLWTGSCDQKGYAQLRISEKQLKYASHVALELAGRPLPKGLLALHHCDNPYCVNADHLFAGTQKDNIADMMSKGRQDHSGLEIGRRIKFTKEKEVAFILYQQGKKPTEIAKQFGVTASAVLLWMKEWGHNASPQHLRQYCPSGHFYSEENTYVGPTHGDRQCRECKRTWRLRNKMRKEQGA
jgi:hypothetical protein